MLAVVALTVLAPASTFTFALGTVHDGVAYHSVSDSYLDAEYPELNAGGLPYLQGGPRRTVLVRFGELRSVLGRNRKILRASLVLTTTGPGEAPLVRADALKMPWGEGPFLSIGARVGTAAPSASAPIWSSTWKTRRSGVKPVLWQQPGASGPEDSTPIVGATATRSTNSVVIDGLAATIQNAVDRPWADNGIALKFGAEVEFYSSQYPSGKPTLIVEAEPVAPADAADLSVVWLRRKGNQWEAKVANLGTKSVPGHSIEWLVDERKASAEDSTTPLAPGESRIVTRNVLVPKDLADPRTHPVEVRVSSPAMESDYANNRRVGYEAATLLTVELDSAAEVAAKKKGFASGADWAQEVVRRWNDVAAERSRFASDPDGVLVRVAIGDFGTGVKLDPSESDLATWGRINDALGLAPLRNLRVPNTPKTPDNLAAFGGLSGAGDNRYEGALPNQVALPFEPEFNPLLTLLPPAPYGPMSSVEVAFLNRRLADPNLTLASMMQATPKTALMTLKTVGGFPLGGAAVRLLQRDAAGTLTEIYQTVTDRSGSLVVPSKGEFGPFGALDADLKNGLLLVEATQDGLTDRRWLPVWRFFDLAHRSKLPAALFDVRLDLPLGPVDRTADLALNRLVTDSTGAPAATLAKLFDGTPDDVVALSDKAGGWIEIDLGRDRTIAEIELVTGSKLPALDVRIYSTGEKLEDADVWFSYPDFDWLRLNGVRASAEADVIALRGPQSRVRYIRVSNLTGGAFGLKAIRIRPGKS